MDSVRSVFDDEISYAASADDCLQASNVCVVTLMSQAYKDAVEAFRPIDRLTVIDCWRQLDATVLDRNIDVISLGLAPTPSEPNTRSRTV